ncbi:DUF4331 domain-containing protein [Aquimarina sp. RZ0]|uniref:DUF4331 domain-containing protein n=1 Tax=Aquimarina sp. RZ0 TaxID=2607730 RepID=UPI0011F28AFA|nr:DUF4331 domain-containing protein [Aquimarina sp. RZ0]KAA1242860.1 DUF4331 domain-containing protein [Aquimarina sp. RZ0]
MKICTINYYIALAFLMLLCGCSEDSDADVNEGSDMVIMVPDFSGEYKQVDHIGRPETTLNYILSGETQDQFNTIATAEQATFQPLFLERLNQMHILFDATYETNYLGLDATQFTSLMAKNALQVSLDGPTSYAMLTGRTLTDDVIDVMLSLMFGGTKGDRFNGQDTDNDGIPDLPILVSDNREATRVNPTSAFPYLEKPYDL